MPADNPEPQWQRKKRMAEHFALHLSRRLSDGGVRSELKAALRRDPYGALAGNRQILLWLEDAGEPFADLYHVPGVRQSFSLAAGLMASFHDKPTLKERWQAHARAQPSRTTDGGAEAPQEGRRSTRLDLGLALAEADRRETAGGKTGTVPGARSPDKMSPREKRLMQLCRTDTDRLPRHLFSVLSYLQGQNHLLPHWPRMAADIEWRLRDPGAVALRWQESYLTTPIWRRRSPTDLAARTPTSDDN